MEQRLDLRTYRPGDAEACCAVINRAVAEMAGLNEAARRLVPRRNVPSLLHGELGHLYTVVCEIAGRCVGVGALDGAEIRRVYVDPDVQGAGVGEVVMSALEMEARRRGLEQVHLEASPSSVSFYEGRGYVSGPEQRLIVGDAEFHFVPMHRTLNEP